MPTIIDASWWAQPTLQDLMEGPVRPRVRPELQVDVFLESQSNSHSQSSRQSQITQWGHHALLSTYFPPQVRFVSGIGKFLSIAAVNGDAEELLGQFALRENSHKSNGGKRLALAIFRVFLRDSIRESQVTP